MKHSLQPDSTADEKEQNRENAAPVTEEPPADSGTKPDKKRSRRKKQEEEELPLYALIGNFIVTFVLTLFLIAVVVLLAFKFLHINIYTILTGSMSPAYPINSLVFSRETDCSTIAVGDTITFAVSETTCVTHRVAAVDAHAHTFTTKGDANETVDSQPVLWDNVLGKVVFALPFGGEQFRWLSAGENRTTVYVTMGVLLGVTILWDIISTTLKHRRRKKKQLAAAAGASEDPKAPTNTEAAKKDETE